MSAMFLYWLVAVTKCFGDVKMFVLVFVLIKSVRDVFLRACLRMFALIVFARPYCARKFMSQWRHIIHRARAQRKICRQV